MKIHRLYITQVFALLIFAGLTSVSPVSALAHPSNDPVVARIFYMDSEKLKHLASKLDVWEVNPDDGYFTAMLSADELSSLQSQGYSVQIDLYLTNKVSQSRAGVRRPAINQNGGIPGYFCYRTVEETESDLSSLAAAHPSLASWIDIGDSWEKRTSSGAGGYDLNVLTLTNKAIPGPKPIFFLMAEVHAREYATAETAARFAEYLITQYGQDPDVTWLLDHNEAHILPMANPDGRKIAEQGYYHRKNINNTNGGTCAIPPNSLNHYGTDLNRNSSFKWDTNGSSLSPCEETYRGPSAASEPETQAIQSYVASIFPDQRGPADTDPTQDTSPGLFITLHSYGNEILWPWGWTYNLPPNADQLETLSNKLAGYSNYQSRQSVSLYPTSGSNDDWAYGELGVAALTIEMGTEFFQSCSSYESVVYPGMLSTLIQAFKAARLPYQSPAGPDTHSITISQSIIQTGQSVILQAVADGTIYANRQQTEPIASVRFSLDAPPWESPIGELQPVDGRWNDEMEQVEADLGEYCLQGGKHTLFVQSQDRSGFWGAPAATTLTIDQNPGVKTTPDQASGKTYPGGTIAYTLTVTNLLDYSETFTVNAGGPWQVSVPASVGPLDPCSSAEIDVFVTIPENEIAFTRVVTPITISAAGDPSLAVQVNLTTQVLPDWQYYLPLIMVFENLSGE